MNPFASSRLFLLRPAWVVKALFDEVFSLPWPCGLSYPPEHPPRRGRNESEALRCERCPQRYGPPLSGGWTRRGCRHPNAPTTVSGFASIWISAHKYGHPAASPTSRGPFLNKLASKNQSVAQRSQASAAVGLLLESAPEQGITRASPPAAPAAKPCPRRCQTGRCAGWHSQTGFAAHLPSHLCKSLAAGGLRPADDPKAAGAQ